MSAKIYHWPQTADGRLLMIVGIMAGWKLDGRDFDAEARREKAKYNNKKARLERKRQAEEEAKEVAEAAAKIVQFGR